MATHYIQTNEADEHIKRMRRFHTSKEEIEISVLFAFTNDLSYPMTTRGFRVLGKTRKSTPKERGFGAGHIVIELDRDWWEVHDDADRDALVDHEMCHIPEPTWNRQGEMGIPALIEHDYELAGFMAVVDRHGDKAIEQP